MTAGDITVTTNNPTTVVGRGPTSYHSTVTITFTTDHGIPDGGEINISLDSAWATTDTTVCSLSGLTEASNDDLTCGSGGSNNFVIEGFAAFTGSATITATFTDVLPPINTGTTNDTVNHLSSLTSEDKNGNTIDEWTLQTNTCTVSPDTDPGSTTVSELETIPPNASQTNVDLYMKFRLRHTLPAGGEIAIESGTGSWTVNTSDEENYIYLSKVYESVVASSNLITFTMAEEVSGDTDIELYVEKGVTNPSTNTTSYFKIETTYENITFDEDTDNNVTTSHQLTVTSAVTGTITQGTTPVDMDNSTANEYADYTFTFQSNQDTEADDYFIIWFPRDFDPYIGDSYIRYRWAEPTYYYINCDSDVLGSDVECMVDHWHLIVNKVGAVEQGTEIVINVYDVMNPTQTTDTEDFQFLHMDVDDSAKAVDRAVGGVAITALAENLTIKSIEVTDNDAFDTADYTIEFYVDETLNGDDEIEVVLPRQYNTNLARNRESISCSLAWVDMDDSSNDLSENSVSGISSCTTGFNYITAEIPSGDSLTFDSETRVYLRISNLSNPEWGFERTASSSFSSDFDANDIDAFES